MTSILPHFFSSDMDEFIMKDKRIDSFARFEASLYMNYYVLYMEELYLYRHLSRYIHELMTLSNQI